PGARATPTGQLPNVPRATAWNALMSSQRESGVAVESAVMLWFDGTGSPTQLGRSDPRSPCSERARPSVTVMGRPLRTCTIPPSFQPPSTAFVTPDQSEPNLAPRPNGSS